jgi:hypothetical protein
MSVNVTEDLLEPTVKVILFLGVFVFTFLFCFYFDFIFDYTICMLFINGIENKQHIRHNSKSH